MRQELRYRSLSCSLERVTETWARRGRGGPGTFASREAGRGEVRDK
ncbi:MAG: hypothetical protein ACLP8X_15205 [Streptosporangiaceae bacterium]